MANFLSFSHINYAGLWVAAQSAIFSKHFSSFKKRCWWIFSLLTRNLKKRKVGVRAGVSKCLRTHTPRRGSSHSSCSLPPLRRKWQQAELSWAMPPHLSCGPFSGPCPWVMSPHWTDEDNELLKVLETRATCNHRLPDHLWSTRNWGGHCEGSDQGLLSAVNKPTERPAVRQ